MVKYHTFIPIPQVTKHYTLVDQSYCTCSSAHVVIKYHTCVSISHVTMQYVYLYRMWQSPMLLWIKATCMYAACDKALCVSIPQVTQHYALVDQSYCSCNSAHVVIKYHTCVSIPQVTKHYTLVDQRLTPAAVAMVRVSMEPGATQVVCICVWTYVHVYDEESVCVWKKSWQAVIT